MNPTLERIIEQQELLHQEIFELSLLADASSNSIVKYGECQEALCKKKAELVNIESVSLEACLLHLIKQPQTIQN